MPANNPLPSQWPRDWLYEHIDGPLPRRAGKWLIAVSRARLDEAWIRLHEELHAGRLGPALKATGIHATIINGRGLILVYTVDLA